MKQSFDLEEIPDGNHERDNEQDFTFNWIEKVEDYNDFYKEEIESLPIFFLYIDKQNRLIKIRETHHILKKNTIQDKELLYIIRKHMHFENKKYTLLSILQYNINIGTEEVLQSLRHYSKKQDNDFDSLFSTNDFITPHYGINDIIFDETIHIFKDLNMIYIVFHEKPEKSNHTQTKKILLQPVATKTRRKYS